MTGSPTYGGDWENIGIRHWAPASRALEGAGALTMGVFVRCRPEGMHGGGYPYDNAMLRAENQISISTIGDGTLRYLIGTSGGTTGWTAANDKDISGVGDLTYGGFMAFVAAWDGNTLNFYYATEQVGFQNAGTATVTGTIVAATSGQEMSLGCAKINADQLVAPVEFLTAFAVPCYWTERQCRSFWDDPYGTLFEPVLLPIGKAGVAATVPTGTLTLDSGRMAVWESGDAASYMLLASGRREMTGTASGALVKHVSGRLETDA